MSIESNKNTCRLSFFYFHIYLTRMYIYYQIIFVEIFSLLTVMSVSTVKVPKYLAIYYGWPSLVEKSEGDLTKASNWFQQFDLIVFGDGIWKTTHGDHLNTKIITQNLITHNKKVFGYVDLGVSTENLTETEMQEAVNGWSAMGTNVRI